MGALAGCGAVGGILLGSATGAVLAKAMPDAMESWGWRIPFLAGLLVGLAGYLLRRQLRETGLVAKHERSPVAETFRAHGPLLVRLAGLAAFNAVGFYLLFVYIVSWLQFADGIAPAVTLEINTVSMFLLLPVMFAMGALSDRVGRKPLLLAATGLAFVTAVPLFWLMHRHNEALVMIGQLGFVLSVGTFIGVQPSVMVEEAPAAVRCTVIALGYNITLGIIGGLSPLIATWLVHRTENDLAPAYMVMLAAAASFLAVRLFDERSRTVLETA
jgi:MHS family proline/betaine transporter-like MFS transporter